jgi:hypothetical protein
MIHEAMWNRAQSLMAADCLAAYKKANPRHNAHGKRRAKPYVTSQRCIDLAKALGENNAERVAAIMLYQFNQPIAGK